MMLLCAILGVLSPLTPASPRVGSLQPSIPASRAAKAQGRRLAEFAKDHYLPLAMVQMGVVRTASDIVAQSYSAYHAVPLRWLPTVAEQCSAAGCESVFALDSTHILAMALVGATTSGLGGAIWLRHLEARLGPTGGSMRKAVRKALTDVCCWGLSVNAANLFLVPLLCGHTVDASLANVQTELVSLMRLEACLFLPFNLLVFSRPDLVPISLRPSCKAMCSFVFSVGLSVACA
jgi:hypothetical protein